MDGVWIEPRDLTAREPSQISWQISESGQLGTSDQDRYYQEVPAQARFYLTTNEIIPNVQTPAACVARVKPVGTYDNKQCRACVQSVFQCVDKVMAERDGIDVHEDSL